MRKFNLVLLAVLVAAVLDSAAQEVLYNGITLPAQWPPRYAEPEVAQPMPVPYLVQKPAVIEINRGRQLFVDSFLIAQTDMVATHHTPRFYAGNPVLEPDREWEKTADGVPYAAPFSDGVWFDESDGKFKMWYLAGAGLLHTQENQSFYTCYAESEDGRHWIKPDMDIVPNTNIVDTQNRDAATVWIDKWEPDPTKRFKMFNVERRPTDRRWQFILKYSADGIHWSEGAAQSGDLYDRSSAFYNPFREKWCLSMRYSTEVSSRSRSYAEADDAETVVSIAHRTRRGVTDRNIVFWFTPDGREVRHPDYPEVDPGIYNFDCIAYESIMLGQYSVWQGPENGVCGELGIQKRNEIFLGYSRDGFHFVRSSFVPFMAVDPSEGAWNWGNVQSACGTPLVVGDSLYFYSSGRRLNNIMWDGYASTGLAVLRRDGFVSMTALGNEERSLLTEKIRFDGNFMFVNADVRGSMTIEITDQDGNPIKGFARKDAVAIKATSGTKLLVKWKKSEIAALKNRIVRIRFHMTDGDLYSFWVSPWISGESRGYLSGGGPGLSPDGIDHPVQ